VNVIIIIIGLAGFFWQVCRSNTNRNIRLIVKACKTIFLLKITVFFACVSGANGSEQDEAEFEDARFEDDWEERVEEVNEGELRLLQMQDNTTEHHHRSRLRVTQKSLDTGWVDMYQCHTNLDATPALQIVFKKGRVRNLQIVSHSKIARTWVENNTVQLEDVSPDSKICLDLETRALSVKGEKIVLNNGPFMRRFLDGFYPMRVSMQVEYPADEIRFLAIKPEGINSRVDNTSGLLEIDVRFEGRLNTAISFEQIEPED
jgi:hypothetical protein